MWARGALRLLVELVGIPNFRQGADRRLSCQAELRTHRLIAQLLKRELAKGLGLPGDLTDVVAGGVCRFERAPESIGLPRRWKELELDRQFHYSESLPRPERLYK
jgi:hypothetical protein